jgi:hypothetical protein
LLWFVAAAAGVLADGSGAGAPSPEELLAQFAAANERLSAQFEGMTAQLVLTLI